MSGSVYISKKVWYSKRTKLLNKVGWTFIVLTFAKKKKKKKLKKCIKNSGKSKMSRYEFIETPGR
jgi:hypothetical protein